MDGGGIYIGALDSKDTTRLLSDTSSAAYAELASGAGYLLFCRGGTLMAQPFDPGKLRLSGGAFPVAEQVGYSSASFLASFSVSQSGVLVYGSAGADEGDELVWFDRTGKRLGTVGEPGRQLRPSLSPDEKQVAVDRFDRQSRTFDVWLTELARGVSTRFTFGPKDNFAPVWSSDGRRIVFTSNRSRSLEFYQKISSGAGKDELLLKSSNLASAQSASATIPCDWSPDGRYLLYVDQGPKTKADLWLLPDPGATSGGAKPIPFLQTEFNEREGAFSPDGKWIAYESDESGKYEVYVQPFPATGAKYQVSKSGGSRPKWRRDGKEIFYLGADRKMMAAEIKTGVTVQPGNAQSLFEARINSSFTRYAVTRDGQRFLIPTPIVEAGPTPATVVINWTAGITR